MKTKREKRQLALKRREHDLQRWTKLLTIKRAAKMAGEDVNGFEDVLAKHGRALHDVQNLRLQLGITV